MALDVAHGRTRARIATLPSRDASSSASPDTPARDELDTRSEGPFEKRCFSCAKSLLFEVTVTSSSPIGNGAC